MADVLANLDFKGVSRILNLPSPSDPNEPARLVDLNSAIEGLAWKDSVRVATQGNINLNSPGATIDGVTLSVGDRVLVKSQTTQSQNGIYVFNGAATPMTRAADANTADELEQAVVTVEEGTSAGATFRQTQVNFTLGTDPVLWTTFGASVPQASETTAGIAEIATQAETNAGTDDQRIVTPLKLANWSGRIRKFTSTIGDGSATQFDITHNFGTRDVIVQVYRTSGNYDQIYCDVKALTTNAVRLNFSSAPASNSLRVTILA
jgi:uncharacterized protein (UPF0333 family)